MSIIRKLLGANAFGTDANGEPQQITMAIIAFNQESYGLKTLQPVIMPVSELDAEPDKVITVVNHFPSGINGQKPRRSYSVKRRHLVGIDSLRALDDNADEIGEFDFSRLGDVVASLKDYGSRTFIIRKPLHVRHLIKNMKLLYSGYKYASVLHNWTNQPRGSKTNDRLIAALSIYDLCYSIPVYQPRRADGVAFRFTLLWEEATKKSASTPCVNWEIFFAANNHKDNLLRIDGQKVRAPRGIDSDYIENFTRVMREQAVKEKKKDNKKKKAPVAPATSTKDPDLIYVSKFTADEWKISSTS